MTEMVETKKSTIRNKSSIYDRNDRNDNRTSGRSNYKQNSNTNRFNSKKKFSNNFGSKNKKNKSSTIDFSRFIKKSSSIETAPYQPKHTFEDFDFHQKIKQNIKLKGFITPTAIQDEGIPIVLKGGDVVGLANTGTGKTAAFLLPMIDKIYKNRNISLLVVVPTRELALQIQQDFISFTKGLDLKSALCIGGSDIRRQIDTIKRRPNVYIGTPGRILDLTKRKVLVLSNCQNVVLDEADRMFDMGFINDITKILSLLPSQKQVLLFSATLSEEVKKITTNFQKDPKTISVRTSETAQNVDQDIIKLTNGKTKIEMLETMLSQKSFNKVIIFGRTKNGVRKLEQRLYELGFKVASIHGDKTQSARQKALRDFRENKIDIFIATDIAARGLDIPNVSHVINYDPPANFDDYTHRIGRTGRAGKKGFALTFV